MIQLETSRSEQEVFGALEYLCTAPGYVHVLAMLSFRDNLVLYPGELTSDALSASYAPERTIRTEFSTLLGLMLKHPVDFSLPAPAEMQRLADQTYALLQELHACLNQPMLAAVRRAAQEAQAGLSREEATPFLSGGVLREAIFYGGESAYSFQYAAFAVERYSGDDAWLWENKGFRIADGRAVAEALSRLANKNLQATLDQLPDLPPEQWTMLPGFTFTLDDIADAANIPPTIAASVLAAVTAPVAPTNAGFTSIGDFNLANACPILRAPSGDYVALQAYGVVEALYDSPYYWMAADKAYATTAFRHRGDFTEALIARRLAEVFGEANVHRGVNVVGNGRRVGEVDVLVLFADRALVVQCKSKKLTLEARRGNDLQLRDDFKKAVQEAYDQAFLCAKCLQDPALRFERADDGVEVAIPALREIYPLCVLSDHYPALAAQARGFLKAESDAVIRAPLVGDVFLIDVLAEMLASPLHFLSYVNRRVGYADRIVPTSELAILGYHLQQNLWLEDKTGMITLAEDFSIPLDAAMTVRRLGVPGRDTPEGVLTRLDGLQLDRLLKAIEARADPAFVDLGFLLLSLNDQTLQNLDRGLKQVAERTRRDGKSHDLTLGFDDSQGGLTVHCSRLPNDEGAARLTDHCRRRKYLHRAESWFGLSVRADDGLPKFGIQLRFPWTYDAAMERATQGMTRKVALRPPLPARAMPKVGRNDACPCGSGKKFKKCCLG